MLTQEELAKLGIPKLTKITDVLKSAAPWDLTHADIVGQDVIVLTVTDYETRFGSAVLSECLIGNEKKQVLFGGEVLAKQLREAKTNLPLLVRVAKNGRYYEFV